MKSWTIVLTLGFIALASERVVSYRIFDFDGLLIPHASHQITPRVTQHTVMVSHYRAQHQLGSQCFINNKWTFCPVSRKFTRNVDGNQSNKEDKNMFSKTFKPFAYSENQYKNIWTAKFPHIDRLRIRGPFFEAALMNPLNLKKATRTGSSNSKVSFVNVFPSPFRNHPKSIHNNNRRTLAPIKKQNSEHFVKSNALFVSTESSPGTTNNIFKKIEHIGLSATPAPVNDDKAESRVTKIIQESHTVIPRETKYLDESLKNDALEKFSIEPIATTIANNHNSVTPYYGLQDENNTLQLSAPIESNSVHTILYKLSTSTPRISTSFKVDDESEYVTAINKNLYNLTIESIEISTMDSNKRTQVEITTATNESLEKQRRKDLFDMFIDVLDMVDRKFYITTFNKLASICSEERRENSISFAQSSLFLTLLLMALSTETDEETKTDIDRCLHLNITDAEKIELTKHVLSTLPPSSDSLKFRWATRLVLGASQNVSDQFRLRAAPALHMYLGKVNGSETDGELANYLNGMVEEDSGGAIHTTFDAEEMSGGVRAVALTTLYVRGRWRSAPTVLNGTRPFRDADAAPHRATRMIRVNDIMRYANLEDCHFQALEIFYATPGLSLLMLIPHGVSLRPLAQHLAGTSLSAVTRRMETMRVAATLPLYTLRMTLLLPSKLPAMGINNLMGDNNKTDSGKIKLSHAVQRLMFWSEAGRDAFKDDGIEWDEPPELEIVVDRPYLYFVRWHNITLLSGNFVL